MVLPPGMRLPRNAKSLPGFVMGGSQKIMFRILPYRFMLLTPG
jgi:hypothetical protein